MLTQPEGLPAVDPHPFEDPIAKRIFGKSDDPPATQPMAYVTQASPPAFLATGDDELRGVEQMSATDGVVLVDYAPAETRVNTTTADSQNDPSVTALAEKPSASPPAAREKFT